MRYHLQLGSIVGAVLCLTGSVMTMPTHGVELKDNDVEGILSDARVGDVEVFGDLPVGAENLAMAAGTQHLNNFLRRDSNDPANACINIDAGSPKNIHWGDTNQFVTINNENCQPALQMIDNTCSHHMDLSNRCTAFCQISSFYFYGPPVPIMGGKICRANEQCEVKQEKSINVDVSMTQVDRHIFDVTASLSPSLSWGFGLQDFSIPIPNIPLSNPPTLPLSSPWNARPAPPPSSVSYDAAPWEDYDEYDGYYAMRLARRNATHHGARRDVSNFRSNIPQTGYPMVDDILIEMRRQEIQQEAIDARLFGHRSDDYGKWVANVHVKMPNSTMEQPDGVTSEPEAKAVENTTLDVNVDNINTDDSSSVVTLGWIGDKLKKIGKGFKKGKGKVSQASEDVSLTLPIPTITSPTASIAANLGLHWTRDWTTTYYKRVDRASFVSLTHKQVPGDGCGAFYSVPIQIGTCGWQATPRVPRAVQPEINNWLANTPINKLFEGSFKQGAWLSEESKAAGNRRPEIMWEVGEGQCPVNYHEYPICFASNLVDNEGKPIVRTVWRRFNCETNLPRSIEEQPVELREHIDFNDFFRDFLLHEPRLFDTSTPRTDATSNQF